MKLVTFGDDPSKIRFLKEPYVNIGLGKLYTDTFSKLEALREWGAQERPGDDALVCFVDGYDVIQFAELDELETKFRSFGADMVVGSETFCWPSPWQAHLFPEVQTKYRFPNSGMYMGTWKAIRHMLEWDQYRLNYDDQGYFQDWFLRQNSVRVVQDHDCILFQNCVFVPLSDFGYSGKRVKNLMKGTMPCFFHFSGKSDRTVGSDKSILECMAKGEPFHGLTQFPKLKHGP